MPALTLLIVDDNELQRRLAQSILERHGHQTMVAASAEEVDANLAAHDATVVLLSAALPGDEARAALTSALRSRRGPLATLPPPIVIVGAGPEHRETAEKLVARGAAGVVPRPWDRERLAAHVELYSVGAAPARVLVVDDSPVQRQATVSVLARAGHAPLEASDGKAALGVLDAHPEIDLVLSDVVMPQMDGYQLCQAVRARPSTKDLPVVMLTSLDDVASQARAVEVGADDVLTKPISATELKARVRSIIRLKTLQRKLARRNQELEQALELRADLTHMVVHDFRNPLSVVLVSADLIDEACREAGLDKASDLARDVVMAAMRLRGFCDDLLDVARLEGGATAPRPGVIRLDDVARQVAHAVKRLADAHKVAVRLDVPERLQARADREWIYRVLQNLVDNALKHAPPGTDVTIRARESGKHATVEVVDQGPGIPEHQRERVFEKFAQLPGQPRRGSGLGLTFCRLAVEAHGGTIEARNAAEGPGAIFAFTLPCA